MANTRTCPVCDSSVKGRSDKKFCSLKCKSIWQYEKRQETEAFFLKVDRHLRTNRKVLKRYNRSGFTTVRRAELIAAGFDPTFFTHYWKNQKGDIYLFVYEYGFLKIADKDKYLLVIWQQYMSANVKA